MSGDDMLFVVYMLVTAFYRRTVFFVVTVWRLARPVILLMELLRCVAWRVAICFMGTYDQRVFALRLVSDELLVEAIIVSIMTPASSPEKAAADVGLAPNEEEVEILKGAEGKHVVDEIKCIETTVFAANDGNDAEKDAVDDGAGEKRTA